MPCIIELLGLGGNPGSNLRMTLERHCPHLGSWIFEKEAISIFLACYEMKKENIISSTKAQLEEESFRETLRVADLLHSRQTKEP